MKILAIESSCDDTAAAVVNERTVLSSVVSSQIAEHQKYGGVVPEIASRRHTEAISNVVSKALSDANCNYIDLDAIAVTFAPGLIGSLLVGVNFAKGLALSLGIPLIPVHHLRSHIAANYITYDDLKPPFLCLVVSGGHSHIVEVKDYTNFNIIGRTRDDAAGECFDKAARAMGLSYPGGIEMDKIAKDTPSGIYKLPYPSIDGSKYDFSFSGLKTAVINIIHNASQKNEHIDIPEIASSLRKRVCDMLIDNTIKAAEDYGYKTIVLAGGVSANSELRSRFSEFAKNKNFKIYFPELKYCGDNAAMVGIQAFYEYKNGNIADVNLNATATLPIDYK